jgi:hypothetical protein
VEAVRTPAEDAEGEIDLGGSDHRSRNSKLEIRNSK